MTFRLFDAYLHAALTASRLTICEDAGVDASPSEAQRVVAKGLEDGLLIGRLRVVRADGRIKHAIQRKHVLLVVILDDNLMCV